jgi:hypothetical protein
MDEAERRQTLLEALQLWTSGNQQGAVDRIRPAADADDPSAVGLIAWFLHQMGEPLWRTGVPYAQKALALGVPWVANYYFGNMLNDPQLRQQVPDLIRPAIACGVPIDPVANALGPYQQGDHATALALIELAAGPWPWPPSWEELLQRARQRLGELEAASGDVTQRKERALEAIDGDEKRVSERAATIETRSKQLETLLEQTTNAEVQTFFEKEASKYEAEGSMLWKWGVGVLSGAAFFAILPIAIYYAGRVTGNQWFADQNLVAAHFAPAVALGAIAGVLLARARGRDRARQRAQDLSVALGTMFVYSGQISQEEERQRFLHEMGRTVIEAFLRADSGPGDTADSGSLLKALLQRS